MKIKLSVISGLLVLALLGCSSGPTIGGIEIPGGAKDASTRDIGKNTQLVYMTDGDMNAACDAQSKLVTAANYIQSGEADTSATYKSMTFTSGGATLTVMCSEEREEGALLGTKVTMTLQGGDK